MGAKACLLNPAANSKVRINVQAACICKKQDSSDYPVQNTEVEGKCQGQNHFKTLPASQIADSRLEELQLVQLHHQPIQFQHRERGQGSFRALSKWVKCNSTFVILTITQLQQLNFNYPIFVNEPRFYYVMGTI